MLQQMQMMQQQMQQQYRTSATEDNNALVTRLATVIRPHPAPVTDAMDKDQFFSGEQGESLSTWLRRLEQKATRENWNHAARREAAIRSLKPGSKAEEWQDSVGADKGTWTEWLRAIKLAFNDTMSPLQWEMMVEGRKQAKGESGSSYVLDKVSLLRKRTTPMQEDEMIDYLTRGLYDDKHQSVIYGKDIVTIEEYLLVLNRLEKKSNPTVSVAEIASLGLLSAKAETRSSQSQRPNTSREELDLGEGSPSLSAMANTIGRIMAKVNQLTNTNDRETHGSVDNHSKGKQLSRQVQFRQSPPPNLMQHTPPIIPGYQAPHMNMVGSHVERSRNTTYEPSLVPLTSDPSATHVRGPDLRMCYHCRKRGHIATVCPDKDKPPVPRDNTGNGRAGLSG
jgi:hypothetical protein